MNNIFFLKYVTINYIFNFLYVMFNENPSMKNFSIWEIYNNNRTKQKVKIL